MSYLRRHSRLLLVAICCAGLGAGASAIATAGAATGSAGHAAVKHARLGALRRFAVRAVHGTAVVHTRQGFVTVTFDRGKVDSVNGQQLTISEGTATAEYQTVTLTIPTTARVRDNGQKASLSDVNPGQRVLVLTAPQQTFVIARTPRTT
ncbi:MAG: hypothetical protein ACLP50_07865, partial [Solirubrobacteraceae bacterium]